MREGRGRKEKNLIEGPDLFSGSGETKDDKIGEF